MTKKSELVNTVINITRKQLPIIQIINYTINMLLFSCRFLSIIDCYYRFWQICIVSKY